MNYKLLFPTYRNRYKFVEASLNKIAPTEGFESALNLGSGEGDYDPMIANFTQQLFSCDLNRSDVEFAKKSNAHLSQVNYQVENALSLSFPDNHFDLIVSVEVIEHVGQPEQMMQEIKRVLKPGGTLIMTFPREDFPWTYDPINRFLRVLGKPKVNVGAYAFGHEYLINDHDFSDWINDLTFTKVERRKLSGRIVGLIEMYWTGIIQHILKDNNSNVDSQDKKKRLKIRPSAKDPFLAKITDLFLGLDRLLFKNAKSSIGLGYILQKKKAVK